jgi:uncharacterized protein DUF3987
MAASVSDDARWPDPLAEAAYQGLAGDMVRLLEPQSEADAVALLVHPMILVATLGGRTPCIRVAEDVHRLNEFVLFCGDTGKARKGLSAGYARRVADALDPEWRRDNWQGGLSTGEGLIDCVRDPVVTYQKGKPVVTDPGVEDKRALIFESEFSRILRVMRRPESTLSTSLRQAWDGESPLRVRARTNRLRATDAHISLIGHIVRKELLAYVNETEAGGGGINRFLILCIQRSKELPFGGHVAPAEFHTMIARFEAVVTFAHQIQMPFAWSEEAAAMWRDGYHALSAPKPGLFGAVVARGEAHTLRLACLYALLDRTLAIQPVHLQAANALWRYAEDSARCVFGDALGDPTADAILRALRQTPDGLTRTMLFDLFGRHLRATEIDRALGVLLQCGLAEVRREKSPVSSRSGERWYACHGHANAK